jgi:four helix bundle protein
MDLVESVYHHTRQFPDAERYGLTSQLRRAAVSVPSNIAEGKGRSSDRELVQFLNNARGSLYEMQTQLQLARRLKYLHGDDASTLLSQATRVAQLVNGMIRRFRTPLYTEPKKNTNK